MSNIENTNNNRHNNTKVSEKKYGLPVGSKGKLGPDNVMITQKQTVKMASKKTVYDNSIHKPSEKAVEIKSENKIQSKKDFLSAELYEKEEKTLSYKTSDNKSNRTGMLEKVKLLKAEKTKTVSVSSNRNNEKRIPFVALITVLSLAILFMFVVIDYVQIFENKNTINEIRKELEAAKEEENRLSRELEQKDDILLISENAINKLGMVGSENQKSVYIDLGENDSIQGYEPKNEDYGAIATIMDALGESAKAWIGVFGN